MFDLFDVAWRLRNADEHGADLEPQRMINLAKCERAIRHLYHTGESLPLHGSNTLQICLCSGTLGQHDRRLSTSHLPQEGGSKNIHRRVSTPSKNSLVGVTLF
jgi:hypothetical protein